MELESTLLESGLLCDGDKSVASLPSTSSSSLIETKQSHPEVLVQRAKESYSNLFEQILANLHEVFLGTKLFPLFSAVPLAIAAQACGLGSGWVFALSLIGLTPLAERVSFLSEQIAYSTGPTVGGLLNATCGNAPELILAFLALHDDKIEIPLTMIVAWVKGVNVGLDFSLLETGSLAMTIFVTAFTLQDQRWHYMKGFVLILFYIVIGVCFFMNNPSSE